MLKETLRILAVVLLLIVVIMDDFPFYGKMKDPYTQLFLALVVIAMILYDPLFGFIMGLVVMLIYYEIYQKVKVSKVENNVVTTDGNKINEVSNNAILLDYITEEHLVSAQNNIVDKNNYDTEVKGVEQGFNNEGMYGAQGIDKQNLNMVGYDHDDKYFAFT